MAATLPTNVVAQTTGHPALHNAVNAAVNEHEGRISSVETRATALESVATIVGAGRPDIPASMTTAVQAQVAAAPVGSTFSSTDGASVGAWQWQKLPSGWNVTQCDTGDITVSAASIVNGWTAAWVKFARIGGEVEMSIKNLDPSAATADNFMVAPTGFKPTASYKAFPLVRVGTGSYGASTTASLLFNGSQFRIMGRSTLGTNAIGPDLAVTVKWSTRDPYPTTLTI